VEPNHDPELEAVFQEVASHDPTGTRTAAVLRYTLDQLYDGQRTGRYRWDQLHKTEKTHCGTLVEINMQREFLFDDGDALDFTMNGIDVDCKYSQKLASWMIPLEARGKIILGLWADDTVSQWSMGVVRADELHLGSGGNRDRKTSLNAEGRAAVRWLFDHAPMPQNVLLHLPDHVTAEIMAPKGDRDGAERVRRLFRLAQGTLISRAAVETAGQQKDSMKRVRGNGGARTDLAPEGIIILGQYESHRLIAGKLGLPKPGPGESISARVTPAAVDIGAEIGGSWWRVAEAHEAVTIAPTLPSSRSARQ